MQLSNLENPLWLVIGSLATWRITSIVLFERIFEKLQIYVRQKFSNTPFGYLFTCFWCFSVWAGLIVSVLIIFCPYLLIPFALSSVAIILQEILEDVNNE